MSSAVQDGIMLNKAFEQVVNSPVNWGSTPNSGGPTNPCTPNRWTGVRCNKNNTNIVELELVNQGLIFGPIAFESLPPSLESIDLRRNQVTGNLDCRDANLPNLRILDVGSNNFSAMLAVAENMTALDRVNASNNKLSTVDWLTFKNKKRLQDLVLNNNRITGVVEIYNIANRTPNVDVDLRVLDIRHNKFSGTVDFAQFQPLGEVGSILMYGNELTCCVGTWLNTYLVNTFSVGANNWRVSGKDLHDFLTAAGDLNYFDFESVVAPGSTFNFSLIYEPRIHKPHYRYINLAGNGLSGNIDQWSRLWTKSLKQMNLAGNQFTGENPDLSLLDDSSDVESLRLDGNDFSGTVTWPIAWPKTLKELKMKSQNGKLVYGPKNCVDFGENVSVDTDVPICGQETPTSAPPPAPGPPTPTQLPPPSTQLPPSTRNSHTAADITAVVILVLIAIISAALYYFLVGRKKRRTANSQQSRNTPIGEEAEQEMVEGPEHLIQGVQGDYGGAEDTA